MTSHTYPIVGAYYRPPAKAILDHLPVGAPLFLRPDPCGSRCNADHSDPTALSVWLRPEAIPESDDLELKLRGYGSSVAELRALAELHIGYIPKDVAATLAVPPNAADIPAEFSVGARGTPRVSFTL
jgi:hypothetical protein